MANAAAPAALVARTARRLTLDFNRMLISPSHEARLCVAEFIPRLSPASKSAVTARPSLRPCRTASEHENRQGKAHRAEHERKALHPDQVHGQAGARRSGHARHA